MNATTKPRIATALRRLADRLDPPLNTTDYQNYGFTGHYAINTTGWETNAVNRGPGTFIAPLSLRSPR